LEQQLEQTKNKEKFPQKGKKIFFQKRAGRQQQQQQEKVREK